MCLGCTTDIGEYSTMRPNSGFSNYSVSLRELANDSNNFRHSIKYHP